MVLIIFFPTQVIRHIFLATVPLAAFVIFGPQSDLLACWFGCFPFYSRKLQPEQTAVPMALTIPHTPRPHKPTVPPELLAPLKEKALPPTPKSSAGTEVSTTDNRESRHESHSPSSLASYVTVPFPVGNQSTVPILQAPIPRG